MRWSLIAACLLLACGGKSGGEPDAGPPAPWEIDAGPVFLDAGLEPGSCDRPTVVMGQLGEVVVTGDTTDKPEGPLDLLPTCDSPATARPPQEIIEYQVPDVGPIGVEFTLVTPGTPSNYDTLVQVRKRRCTATPGEDPVVVSCFDDHDPEAGEFRSSGTFGARGGDVVYLVVTGYPMEGSPLPGGGTSVNRGPWEMSLVARRNDLPDAVSGEMRLIDNTAELDVIGSDRDLDVIKLEIAFTDGTFGNHIAMDWNLDGRLDGNLLVLTLDPPPSMDPFPTSQIWLDAGGGFRLARAIRAASPRATHMEVRYYDHFFETGGRGIFPVRERYVTGLGSECDRVAICAPPLRCESSVCVIPASVSAACDGAADLTPTTPSTVTTTASSTGTITPGSGAFGGSCGLTSGVEVAYAVTVPAGDFDLLARTDLPGTTVGTVTTDTVLHLRTICADSRSEVGCNDDISTDEPASALEVRNVAPATYALFVEAEGATADVPFELEVALRPVLPAGGPCDPAGLDNRCAATACDSATSMCP